MNAASVSDYSVSDYNVVWDSPSQDYYGSMPLGNGDIGANVWVDQNGEVHFYIGKTDTWSGSGRLLKAGKVRVRCEPPLFEPGKAFKQTLDLKSGSIRISAEDIELCLYIDACNPVISLSHSSSVPTELTAYIDMWRKTETSFRPQQSDLLAGGEFDKDTIESDKLVTNLDDQIGWYHHTTTATGFDLNAKLQGLSEYFSENPLSRRTFGAIITGSNAERVNDTTLRTSPAKSGHISVHILTRHPSTPASWLMGLREVIRKTEEKSLDRRYERHKEWWTDFWSRSWIHVSQGEPVDGRILPDVNGPFTVGVSREAKNASSGIIKRFSVFRKALSEREIVRLAKGEKSALTSRDGLVASLDNIASGAILEPVLREDLSKSASFECWIQPGQSSSTIFSKKVPGSFGSNLDGFGLELLQDGCLVFMIGAKMRGGATAVRSNSGLPAGRWSHVVVVTDGRTDTIRLYVDGRLVDESTPCGGSAYTVSRAYALQRYIDACAGRGAHPIRFNGSLFTVPETGEMRKGEFPDPFVGPGDPDHNAWGPGYWWQNTRLPYQSMCAAGDYDLMQPFIRMYVEDIYPLCRYRTKTYTGQDGACFPEVLYFWGSMCSLTWGWTPPYEKRRGKYPTICTYTWVCGPELACMLFDYFDYTLDRKFLDSKLLPLAIDVLRFFDNHYRTVDGKLVMHPSQAVETWTDCTNPMTELAGLHALTRRVLALGEGVVGDADRAFCERLLKKLPSLPTRMVEGKPACAPAEKWTGKSNYENPELYGVFPFRLCSFEKDNRELGLHAFKHRWDRASYSWHQNDIFAAYLGLAGQAKQSLVLRCRNSDPRSRFPAFWGPTWNAVPCQDHGGVMMKALQAMILQPDPYSRKVYVAPAWPKDWNCEFKLHAPYKTIIKGRVTNGKVSVLSVIPESRRKDVVVISHE